MTLHAQYLRGMVLMIAATTLAAAADRELVSQDEAARIQNFLIDASDMQWFA